MKVAKPPLSFLHIGFDDIARIAHAPVPLIALGQLFGDEAAGIARDHLGIEACRRLVVEVAVAPDAARFDQRGADGQILLRGADQLVERARRMTALPPPVTPSIQPPTAPTG